MGGIRKLVWTDIIINIAPSVSLWYFLSSFRNIIDKFSYDDRLTIHMVSLMVKPFAISTAIQIISLLVLFKSPRLGLVLAMLGSIFMLPLSLVFVTGYILSYENYRNRNFSLFRKKTIDTGLTFNTTELVLLGMLLILIGLMLWGMVGMVVGSMAGLMVEGVMAGCGIIKLYNAYRLKKKVIIGITQDKLILTPSMYSDTYLIPLSDVSLIKDTRSSFKLHIKSADVDRKYTFYKRLIAEDSYQETLKNIFSKLATQV